MTAVLILHVKDNESLPLQVLHILLSYWVLVLLLCPGKANDYYSVSDNFI